MFSVKTACSIVFFFLTDFKTLVIIHLPTLWMVIEKNWASYTKGLKIAHYQTFKSLQMHTRTEICSMTHDKWKPMCCKIIVKYETFNIFLLDWIYIYSVSPRFMALGVCSVFFWHKNINLIYHLFFVENKGDLILQLKHWGHILWLFLKNKVLIILVDYYVHST